MTSQSILAKSKSTLIYLAAFAVAALFFSLVASSSAAPPSSLRFDGINDIVRTVNLPLMPQFTIEAWAKRTADSGTYQSFLSDANIAYSQAMFTVFVDGGNTSCGASDQWAYYQQAGGSTQCSGLTADLNAWHHIAVTRDASGARRFFVDGILRNTQTNSPAPTDSTGMFTLGRAGDFNGEYSSGLLDEIRLSNVALYTASFTPPIAPLPVTANTIALWSLDEGAGQTVVDRSGNGRHGTLGSSADADVADPIWSTDSPIGDSGATSTVTATATAPATPTDTPTATPTLTPEVGPSPTATLAVPPVDSPTPTATSTPTVAPTPNAAGYALRFYGHGATAPDLDRVKIQIDDPVNSNPGPPADVGATDFTLEFWMRANAAENAASAVVCGANNNWIYGNILVDRDRFSQDRKYGLSVAGSRLVLGVTGEGTGNTQTLCGTTNVLDGQWHHIAVQRRLADGWLWLYVDGDLDAQVDGPEGDISYPDDGVPGNYCNGPCLNSDPYLVLGAEKHDAGAQYPSYSGWMDELRLSTALRYTGTFTVSLAPFVSDAETAALYHFDEGPAGACTGTTLEVAGAIGGPSTGVCRYGGLAPSGPVYATEVTFPPPAAPTSTPTVTETPMETLTPTPADTGTPTTTATETATPTETDTPTITPTAPPPFTPTDTGTPTATVTETATPTETDTPTITPTAPPTFTPTDTRTSTPTVAETSTPTITPTATATATPTPTSPADIVFADGFESGDLLAWSASLIDGGDLRVSLAAAWVGAYGLQAVIDDNVALYVTDDRPNAEPRYRMRFYFDPNTIPMTSGNAHYIIYGYMGTSTVVFRVEFRFSTPNYQLRAALLNDATTWSNSAWVIIGDAPHSVEIDWRSATAAGANNGGLTLWIDEVQSANLTAVDNDTRRIDRVRLGPVAGLDSGTRGIYYFDAFEARRTTYIGPAPGAPTPTPASTPTATPTRTSTPTVTATPLISATPTRTATSTPTVGSAAGDDFNRADSTALGTNWTERSGDLRIVTQTLQNAGTGGDVIASWNGGAFSNMTASVQLQIASGTGSTSLGVRLGSYASGVPMAGYTAELRSNGQVVLWRVNDWAQLGTYTISGYAAGQWVTLALRATGSTLNVDVNGVTRISASDSNFASGEIGLWSYAATAADQHRFDNFTVLP